MLVPNEVDNLLFFISLFVGTSFQLPHFVVIFRVASGNGVSLTWHIVYRMHSQIFAYSTFVRLLIESIIYLSRKQFNTTQEEQEKRSRFMFFCLVSTLIHLCCHCCCCWWWWFSCCVPSSLPFVLFSNAFLYIFTVFIVLLFRPPISFSILFCWIAFFPFFFFAFKIHYVLEIDVHAWQCKEKLEEMKQKSDHSVEKFATHKCMMIIILII